ncbi:hypothetical protein HOLleu_31105 [Holothuria leucospilota]|uniref:Uncharacterized protein n=1 Tax=Holothuria leucospilota TaxID=206669 RepID=A0A9Q1H1P1_HOLLE|nr:hypothetical protein HOLleu_31105 [Holothuria leucospilota]
MAIDLRDNAAKRNRIQREINKLVHGKRSKLFSEISSISNNLWDFIKTVREPEKKETVVNSEEFDTVCEDAATLANSESQRVEITHTWDGVGAYIKVKRQAVQEKLDAFNNRTVEGRRAPQLYLPTSRVFYDILSTDYHVVYIDFGFVGSDDFADEKSISSYGTESAIMIPFLADSPGGFPKYSLSLGQYYQRDRGDISRVNINFPYYGIDELTVTETGAVWRNGSDELTVSFVKSNPCKAPPSNRRHEFDVMIKEELQFSFSKPDLGFCDRHSIVENPLCDIFKSIRSDVETAGFDVCQVGGAVSQGTCDASFAMLCITDGFRDLLLLKDDPIEVVASERFYGRFKIILQYPCLG